MREIKFRAWDKKAKKMITDEKDVLFVVGCDGSVMRSKTYGPDITSEYEWHCESEPTEDLIVMQFTGLKDKNGKEIFEGDILRRLNGRVSEVVFESGAFFVRHSKTDSDFIAQTNWFEVIGNIYSNPELLSSPPPERGA